MKRAAVIALGAAVVVLILVVATVRIKPAFSLYVHSKLGGHDTIVLTDQANASSQGTLFLTGSRFGGCFCLIAELPGSLTIDNVTGGPSQAAVLSRTHRLSFLPDVTWLLDPEVKPLSHGPAPELPLALWTLSHGETASSDASFAQKVFAENKTGINITHKAPKPVELVAKGADPCLDVLPLLKADHYRSDAVNVYYVGSSVCDVGLCHAKGLSCRNDRQAIFVFSDADEAVLAHELGHALGFLNHWVSTALDKHNVMLPQTASHKRSHFTAGQAIFMNEEKTSVLKTLRKEPGLECVRDCPSILVDEESGVCSTSKPLPPSFPDAISTTDAWLDCIECTDGELARLLAHWDGAALAAMSATFQAEKPPAGDLYGPRIIAGRQRRAAIALSLRARTLDDAGTAARRALVDASRTPDLREDIAALLDRLVG
jgi:hypothetical protein